MIPSSESMTYDLYILFNWSVGERIPRANDFGLLKGKSYPFETRQGAFPRPTHYYEALFDPWPDFKCATTFDSLLFNVDVTPPC